MAGRSHNHVGMPSGPFRAGQLPVDGGYELSDGHPILVSPTGARGGDATKSGNIAIATDPDVEEAGVDVGYQLDDKTVRAPDISIGNVPVKPGWVSGAPPLAIEYADTGQDDVDLKVKIAQLMKAGTRLVWVVRLMGPRRVEVHEPGKPMRTVTPGGSLVAPGILRNPVPVIALYDREAAFKVALRNLAQREGYESLEAALESSHASGWAEAIINVLEARGVALDAEHRARIVACTDIGQLRSWSTRAGTAGTVADVFDR